MDDSANQPRTTTDATSLSLLLKVQGGQADAWDHLVQLYGPLIYHWCRRGNLGTDDTADVFQEVFRAVAEHIKGFRRDRAGDTFRGWLRIITRNKINDHFRRQAGQPAAAGGTDAQLRLHGVADPISPEDDTSELNIVHHQLRQVLESLSGEFENRTWQAFWQVQMENRSTDEVGHELGMTAAAVRKAKYRVLRRLREELGDLLDSEG